MLLEIREVLVGPVGPVVLVALWMALPTAFLCWVHQIFVAPRTTSDFALHSLESIELSRATLLYGRAFNRIEQINKVVFDKNGSLRARYRRRAELRRQHRKEFDDLTAYAAHLRAMIIRIRRQPMQRFQARARLLSLRFAFSSALVIYGSVLALLLGLTFVEKPVWFELLTLKYEALLIGHAVREPVLYAHAAASALMIVVTPVLYWVRRVGLEIGERPQIRLLKDFATPDPAWLFHREGDPAASDPDQGKEGDKPRPELTWTSVLEVPGTATIEEIKEAYKRKVKQNHPDRVHGMAPTFRHLADAETKKLNLAYDQAVMSVRLG